MWYKVVEHRLYLYLDKCPADHILCKSWHLLVLPWYINNQSTILYIMHVKFQYFTAGNLMELFTSTIHRNRNKKIILLYSVMTMDAENIFRWH